jgi:holo-[acyl-carrier protein] synthase
VIVSIGIDITEVARVREVLARTTRFRERVFTAGERAYCDAKGASAPQHYAARFAAKEAVFKALRTGWSGGLAWHHVEVSSRETGEPVLLLHGRARELFDTSGATDAHLSLSHTSEHAVAQVVFERREPQSRGR